MISKLLASLGVCSVLMVGCSSTPTRVDKSPLQATTFSMMPSTAPSDVAVNPRRAEAHQLIQGAIARELAQKGLKQVSSGADVQVGYLVIVADNATTTTYDDYFGFGDDAAALTRKAHKTLQGRNSRDYFEVGALVIDVVDGRSGKLLYRSYVVTDVQDMTPANRADRINRLVASCLGRLRIGA